MAYYNLIEIKDDRMVIVKQALSREEYEANPHVSSGVQTFWSVTQNDTEQASLEDQVNSFTTALQNSAVMEAKKKDPANGAGGGIIPPSEVVIGQATPQPSAQTVDIELDLSKLSKQQKAEAERIANEGTDNEAFFFAKQHKIANIDLCCSGFAKSVMAALKSSLKSEE